MHSCAYCGREYKSECGRLRHQNFKCLERPTTSNLVTRKRRFEGDFEPVVFSIEQETTEIVTAITNPWHRYKIAYELKKSVPGICPLIFPPRLVQKYDVVVNLCAVNEYDFLKEVLRAKKDGPLQLPKNVIIKGKDGKTLRCQSKLLNPNLRMIIQFPTKLHVTK